MNDNGAKPDLCTKDGRRCYIAGDEPHWRCGTSACGAVAGADLHLSDQQLAAANMAYTKVLFPECSERQLADEWERMGEPFRQNTQAAMLAAIRAALA